MSLRVLFESAVGMVGRTGAADAKAHVGAELRAKFKKIVKEIGGKTVARQLLAEMNAGGSITEGTDFGDIKELANLIASLDKKLDNDEKYEEFFGLIDDSGLDTIVSHSIDNSVGDSGAEIKSTLKSDLKKNYEKNGTEPAPAVDLAISSIKSALKKLKL